jgi:GNAT superfamily N-acetyltransferase
MANVLDNLKFEPVANYERGIIFSLLQQSFMDIWNDEMEEKIKQYDKEVFDNPNIVGACVLITSINGEAIGMASWDPRQGPHKVILGYNCILPDFQNKGFGLVQLRETLRRLKAAGFREAAVTTGEHSFFIPAIKMYLACGFKECKRYNKGRDPRYGSIDYELEL